MTEPPAIFPGTSAAPPDSRDLPSPLPDGISKFLCPFFHHCAIYDAERFTGLHEKVTGSIPF